MLDYQTIMPITAAITTIGGAWITVRKIAKDAAKSKKEQIAEILHAAKEEDAILKNKLESRIEHLKNDLQNLEISVEKDLAHLKETYLSEIKVLGGKIEEIRNQLNTQHSQLISFLSKLIDKK